MEAFSDKIEQFALHELRFFVFFFGYGLFV